MRRLAFLIALGLVMASVHADAQQPARVTILYDAFGPTSALQRDWGFAALVEYGGRRILFDTGNDAAIFAGSVKQRGVCRFSAGRDPSFSNPFPPDVSTRLSALGAPSECLTHP
jgi:hypothetical protein